MPKAGSLSVVFVFLLQHLVCACVSACQKSHDVDCFGFQLSEFLFCRFCGRANSTWTDYRYRFFNNVVITTVDEMVEILDGRLGKHSVERDVINNLLHLVIVKYGDISLVLCISTRLRLVTMLSQLVKYISSYYT